MGKVFVWLLFHTIFRKQNYRNIPLDEHTEGETVGVLTRDGRAQQIRWLGFIKREDASRSRGRPMISRVEREDLKPGQYVRGCLVEEGVYAVIDSEVDLASRK